EQELARLFDVEQLDVAHVAQDATPDARIALLDQDVEVARQIMERRRSAGGLEHHRGNALLRQRQAYALEFVARRAVARGITRHVIRERRAANRRAEFVRNRNEGYLLFLEQKTDAR